MVQLQEDDSAPRVEDATERHISLCGQVKGGEKYPPIINPTFNTFGTRRTELKQAAKNLRVSRDSVKLQDTILDDTLRNLHGRTKEYDRDNTGSNTNTFIFPDGNISGIVTLPNDVEPDAAHAIAQKVIALGETHTLYPYAAQIEAQITKCREALKKEQDMITAEGDARTALTIAKVLLVRQYNANYFIAASDVDKSFAEKLFPKLRPSKKKGDPETDETEEEAEK